MGILWHDNSRTDCDAVHKERTGKAYQGAHFHPHLGDTHIRISGFGANHQPTRMGVSLLRVIYAERHYILLPFCPL